jgi:hypothetical protein
MVPSGFEVYRGPSIIDGAPIVAIMTLESQNTKTGNMAQLWILPAEVSPSVAVHTGADASVCGACPLRGAIVDGRNRDRVCYVKTFQAPRSVWESWRRGNYPAARIADVMRTIGDRPVRIGAYGDPAAVPLRLIRAIAETAARHTGYTHDWRARPDLAPFVMASADTADDRAAARAAGFRTFRSRGVDDPIGPGEITCPASDEAGKRTSCARCGLCNGSRGADDRRADIAILIHGANVRTAGRAARTEPAAGR